MNDRGSEQPTVEQSPLANISRRLVQLYKEFYGKGPTRAKTYHEKEAVFVVLHGGFTRVEQTLRESGRGEAVMEQRNEFHDAMRARFRAVIEEELDRKVAAFLSANHQDPDLSVEVFVLEPAVEHPQPEPDSEREAVGSCAG